MEDFDKATIMEVTEEGTDPWILTFRVRKRAPHSSLTLTLYSGRSPLRLCVSARNPSSPPLRLCVSARTPLLPFCALRETTKRGYGSYDRYAVTDPWILTFRVRKRAPHSSLTLTLYSGGVTIKNTISQLMYFLLS